LLIINLTKHRAQCKYQIKLTEKLFQKGLKMMLSQQRVTFRYVSFKHKLKSSHAEKQELIDLINLYKTRTFDEELNKIDELGGTLSKSYSSFVL
jgi:hypothetical protein